MRGTILIEPFQSYLLTVQQHIIVFNKAFVVYKTLCLLLLAT